MHAPAHHYRIVTRWRLRGKVEETAAIVRDTIALPRWWPAAFLEARMLAPGDRRQVGMTVWLRTKGFLPYCLRFHVVLESVTPPGTCQLRVWGDFEGGCVCEARPKGDDAELVFDWHVAVRKPLVRRLSWLLKPVFVANHLWVMRRGRESLERELLRRRAPPGATVPPPPGPTFPHDRRTRALVEACRQWGVTPGNRELSQW